MSSARTLAIAGLLLALATACGAFGAHALRNQLAPERLQLWDTAVRYQFFQALGHEVANWQINMAATTAARCALRRRSSWPEWCCSLAASMP